jgi:hypothetical protein
LTLYTCIHPVQNGEWGLENVGECKEMGIKCVMRATLWLWLWGSNMTWQPCKCAVHVQYLYVFWAYERQVQL